MRDEGCGQSGERISRKECMHKNNHILYEALTIFFPPRCPFCDEVLYPGQKICKTCTGKIRLAEEPVCARCGKPLQNERNEYCGDCQRREHFYTQGKAVYYYEGAVRQSLYRFKYHNRREYAIYYAASAAQLYSDWIKRKGVEVIIPIPMYEPKRRRRGYNQAEVFARALGRELGIPVDAKLVCRIKNTTPQKELNDKERRANLKNAFQLQTDIVEYNQILLVDDIYTTGSTIDAVAEILLATGIQNIYYICVGIGIGC
jgi:ComF family protein